MYVLSSSDRIMITKMIDTTSTAIYSVAYTVASVIQIFWVSIEASLSPWIYENLDRNRKIFIISLMVILMSIVVSFLYSYIILRYIFIVALVGVCIVNRKKIMRILKAKQ